MTVIWIPTVPHCYRTALYCWVRFTWCAFKRRSNLSSLCCASYKTIGYRHSDITSNTTGKHRDSRASMNNMYFNIYMQSVFSYFDQLVCANINGLLKSSTVIRKPNPNKRAHLIGSWGVKVSSSILEKKFNFWLTSCTKWQQLGRDGAGRSGRHGSNVGHLVTSLDGEQVSGQLFGMNL